MERDQADDGLAESAAIVLAGLLIGALPLARAIAWADKAIARLPAPPSWLIDLSMSAGMRATDRLKLLVVASRGANRDRLIPVALWREAVSLGFATAPEACEQLASIDLPIGARKRALRLSGALAAAETDAARAALEGEMIVFLGEYGRRSRHAELAATIMAG